MTAASPDILATVRQRRRTIVQGFLWTLFCLVVLTMLLNVVLLGPAAVSLPGLAPNLFFLAVIGVALWLNHHHQLRLALGLIIVVVLAAASLPLLLGGLTGSEASLFLFFIPVVLAGLLTDRRALFLTGGASLAVVLLAAFLQQTGRLPGGAPAAAGWTVALQFAVVGLIVVFFLDRFGLSLQKALTEAAARQVELQRAQRELREMNETLERRVQERTRRLEETNRELEAFSYSVSHDLRSPLRAIHGFAQILEEDFAEGLSAEGQEYLGLIRDNARQMGQLIDDLLAFSRLSRQALTRREVDMQALVKQALADLHDEMAGRELQLEIGELPEAHADPSLVRQLLVNLLSNAVKFTRNRPDARIEVGATCQEGVPVYFVRDNGAGFDMRYVDKLFGVFQRLHAADEYEGTGVGLALVQRVALRHGGRVWAEGEVDQGAAFYFTLQPQEAA